MNQCRFRRPLIALFALGMASSPCISVAGLIQHPFNSNTATKIASFSISGSVSINNDGAPLGSRVYFGKLDLNNNDMLVYANDKATALSNLANITDMVRAGYGPNHDWTGNGITSGVAQLDHSEGYGITALGVILNDDGSGNPIWGGAGSDMGSFDGYTSLPAFLGGRDFSIFDVIVKYTFLGDTLLTGNVTGGDLGTVAANYGTGKGWINGEFNYTGGVVNNLDVYEVNHSLLRESQYPLVTPVTPDPPPPTPEPSTFVLAVLGLLGLPVFSIRRRRWNLGGVC
ncbi:MAG TPA: PEP-CTERM sorting domain-containing protein [Pirellulales bacterium]|jgi:hypothetical protein|nr:PEP-CTERM sorting domain-containing protein [Pirellulales bacterium]